MRGAPGLSVSGRYLDWAPAADGAPSPVGLAGADAPVVLDLAVGHVEAHGARGRLAEHRPREGGAVALLLEHAVPGEGVIADRLALLLDDALVWE